MLRNKTGSVSRRSPVLAARADALRGRSDGRSQYIATHAAAVAAPGGQGRGALGHFAFARSAAASMANR